MTPPNLQVLIPYLPVRSAGWTQEQALAYVERQRRRALQASKRLLERRPVGTPLPRTPDDLMRLVDDLAARKTCFLTQPEIRALRLWHRLVRANANQG